MDHKNWKEAFFLMWKRKGDSWIQLNLEDNVEINDLNTHGRTLLSYAAGSGNLQMIEFLVQNGADGNVTDSDGSKPLHIATKCRHMDVIKYFVDAEIYIDSRDNDGQTPLLCASCLSDLSSVKYFIESGADVECRNNYGWTLLHSACENEWIDVMQYLVNKGCNLDNKTCNGATPLIVAASKSNLSVVEYLIESGADVECGHDEYGWTLFHFACVNRWIDIMKYLVGIGCDLNVKTADGITPLLLAADILPLSVVEYLIASGADVDCGYTEKGWTVLHCACAAGWVDIVKYLVSKGWDLNDKTTDGCTPLLVAASSYRRSVVKYLIDMEVYVKDCHEGKTILHWVCLAGWTDIVKSVLDKGCDPNTQDNRQHTPLYFAIYRCNLEIIVHLLEAGKNGAFFTHDNYIEITKNPELKQGLLQNTDICTLAVLNKFNNSDLPEIYKIPVVAERLPAIEKLKITSHSNVAQDITNCVYREIQTNGYCDVLNVRPIMLSSFCVRSLTNFFGS